MTDEEIIGAKVLLLNNNPNLTDLVERARNDFLALSIKTCDIGDSWHWAKTKIDKDDTIGFWDESIILDPQELYQLSSCLRRKKDAGIVTGLFTEFPLKYRVNNIYEPTQTFGIEGKVSRLLKIDMAFPYLIVCKGSVFQELNFEGDMVYFGLGLRKLGYQNYLDTSVLVSYGDENE